MTVPAFYVAVCGNEIVYVGDGKPVQQAEARLLSGDLARLLYRAIAGHDYHENPDNASHQRVSAARKAIYNGYNLPDNPGLDVAQMALLKFDDDYYWPGYWQPGLDEAGQLVRNTHPAPKEMPEITL